MAQNKKVRMINNLEDIKKDVTFKHSGDMGDIIYSLPTIKQMGGGILYLDINGGNTSKIVRANTDIFGKDRLAFNVDCYQFLEPLLKKQDYIKELHVWNGEVVDHDLDEFRKVFAQGGFNLAECHLVSKGIKPTPPMLSPWLKVMPNVLDKKIAVARSLKRQSNHDFWDANATFLKEEGFFIGTELEHQVFSTVFQCEIEHKKVDSALEAAQFIAGAKECWANTTLMMCLAIAMGISFRQEGYAKANGNIFMGYRPNGIYV